MCLYVCVLPPLLLRDPVYEQFKELRLTAHMVFSALSGVGMFAINHLLVVNKAMN